MFPLKDNLVPLRRPVLTLVLVALALASIWIWDVAALPAVLAGWAIWIAGRSTEDSVTRPNFALFCIVIVGAAAIAHDHFDGSAAAAGLVALSGAVVGAYLRLYPRGRIQTLVLLPIVASIVEAPAMLVAAVWLALQAAIHETSLGVDTAIWLPIAAAGVGAIVFPLLQPTRNPSAGHAAAAVTDTVSAS